MQSARRIRRKPGRNHKAPQAGARFKPTSSSWSRPSVLCHDARQSSRPGVAQGPGDRRDTPQTNTGPESTPAEHAPSDPRVAQGPPQGTAGQGLPSKPKYSQTLIKIEARRSLRRKSGNSYHQVAPPPHQASFTKSEPYAIQVAQVPQHGFRSVSAVGPLTDTLLNKKPPIVQALTQGPRMSPRETQSSPSKNDGAYPAPLRTLSILRRAAREKAPKSEAQRSIDRDFLLRLIRERLSALTPGRA